MSPALEEELSVPTATGSYPVRIGSGLLGDAASWDPLLRGRDVLVVTDTHVAAHHLAPVRARLAMLRHDVVVLAPGEDRKTLDTAATLFAALAALGAGRDAVVVALGGGVVGDLAGFAAACWMRGIDCLQVPTTLLAMVDSSIGGKTGVNLPAGKNLVGAFHPPVAVIADTDTLATLPARERVAGLAEVAKYAAIGDAGFFAWLERHAAPLRDGEASALARAVATSCRHKASVVARDEHERGERALLNFGHSFGHALEAATGYGTLLHGEAVALGMRLAARLSTQLGLAGEGDAARLDALLGALGLPGRPPPLDARQLLGFMRLDKKNRDGRLRLVLWRGIGAAFLATDVDEGLVADLLARSLQASAAAPCR
jgi:3-dehydroquinate synthase